MPTIPDQGRVVHRLARAWLRRTLPCITPDGSQLMDLPLNMRATLLAASLDVIAEEIDAVRRGRPVSPTLEALLAEAQRSARLLAEELHPAQAMAVGERRPAAAAMAAPVPVREFSDNVVQLRPRRS